MFFRMGNQHTAAFSRQNQTEFTAKNLSFGQLLAKPSETPLQASEDMMLASKLDWLPEMSAQRSQMRYSTVNNGLNYRDLNSVALPIMAPPPPYPSIMFTHGGTITRRSVGIGCTNPYVYELPNGTIVDMASRSIYKKHATNNSELSSRQDWNQLVSSSVPLTQQSYGSKPPPPVKKIVEVVDLTVEGSSAEEEENFPKILSTFSLTSKNSPLSPNDLNVLLNKGDNGINNASVCTKDFPTEINDSCTARDILNNNHCLTKETSLRDHAISTAAEEVTRRPVFVTSANQRLFSDSLVNLSDTTQGARSERANRRKASHTVRQDFSAAKNANTAEQSHLAGVAISSPGDKSSTGTPWVLRITGDKLEMLQPSVNERQVKIKTLKRLLSKQEKAVENLRCSSGQTSSEPYRNQVEQRQRGNKVNVKGKVLKREKSLVLRISNLGAQFQHLIAQGKRSFRISLSGNGALHVDDVPITRRSRKSSPRKLNPNYMYPSYVTCDNLPGLKESRKRGLQFDRTKGRSSLRGSPVTSDDEEADVTYEPRVKRKRGRPPKQKTHPNNGRRSPYGGEFRHVAVLAKDAWHVAVERLEESMQQSREPLDQDSYLLFLGLRRT